MKILFCSQYYQTKSVGPAHLVDMFLHINEIEKACKVKILTPDTQENSDFVYKLSVSIPKKLIFLDVLIYNWAYFREIKNIKKTYQPDIILFGNSLMGVLSSLFFSHSIKFVGFINDYFYLETNINNFRLSKRWFYLFFIKQIQYFSVLLSHQSIACSFFLTDLLKKNFPLQAPKFRTLYQGIDIQKFPFLNRKYPFDVPINIVFIKKLNKMGGLDILVEALSQIKNHIFELHIVSSNCDKLAIWQQENTHIIFKFHGLLTQNQIYHLLEKSDILCVPSRKESLGIVNIEGLASGIAVISVKTGGIPEVLDNFGWLAEPTNADSLAKKILECLNTSPSVLAEKSKNGRLFVEQNFDYKYLSKKLLDICKSVSKN